MIVPDSHASEYSCKAARAFLTDYFVKLGGVLCLDIGSSLDLARDFAAVFEGLLWLVKLREDHL